MSLGFTPQIEAQLADYARPEGIERGARVEKMARKCQPLTPSSGDSELGGKTLRELYGHVLGTVSFEISNLAERDEEYVARRCAMNSHK